MEETQNPKLYRIRHSLAHVLAQAVLQKFPQAQLGFGPPTDQGFFYDFDLKGAQIHPDDLKEIEKTMKKIIGQAQKFTTFSHDKKAALAALNSHRVESYKQQNIDNLAERGVTEFSFYQIGTFLDLCEGPHVEHTGQLPADAFKLDRIAGAYWLGDEKNPMLTRIYALAFETRAELDDFIKRRKLAEEYDHKKLGKELDFYHFDDEVGKGLPLWLPNGTVIRNEVQRFAEEVEFQFGYQRVATPNVAKSELYLRSQHLPAYEDSMFPPMEVKDEGQSVKFYLKPMNCPHHHKIYSARPRSYRDLPLRLAEYGTCYRYEQSGELSGLLRVRCMTMNDAHIYLRLDQFESEFKEIMRMYLHFYTVFKLKDYRFRLSIRGKEHSEKYKGSEEMWNMGEAMLKSALDDLGVDYFVGEGEAAFYGPKVDIQFKNLMGREETVSTIQVDFYSPERFELTYRDQNGQDVRPIILHRAPLSTHERFISYLIEYYGGAFPTWCAPVQVAMIPVNEQATPYCKEFAATMKQNFMRVVVDESDNTFNKKIRTNTVQKVPIILIVGDKEREHSQVTIRRYGQQAQETVSKDEFLAMVLAEVKDRVMLRTPMASIL